MELTEILTTYWSQFLLLFAVVGYFAKRAFDLSSKKTEVNHNLFQQNRLSTVNRFFENYSKSELMWYQIAIYDILERKLSPKEIDKIVFPVLNELDKNLLELMIYFEEIDLQRFKLMVFNIKSINAKLSETYFDYSEEKTLINKSNEFALARDKALQKNERILKELSASIKKTFK